MADGGRLDPKKDPRRRCLKLEAWPDRDRDAWRAAVAQGDLLRGGGAASGWRENTRRAARDAYGRWLTFLDRSGWLDPALPPLERMSPDRLRAYIADLQETVAPITVRNRITNLDEALRVMAPGNRLDYLRRARLRLKARARPVRDKRRRIAPIKVLFRLGLELTAAAEREETRRPSWRAAKYRDGLMIMMLANRPLRRTNFAGLRLDRHLVKREEGYAIVLDEGETKNGRPFDQPLHPALSVFVDRYFEAYRPVLLGGRHDDHVWVSWRGKPMSAADVYFSIVTRTKAGLSRSVSPHLFRDSAVTSMGEVDPVLVWLAPALLHHADPRMAERYYDQALDARAVALWQDHLLAMRRAMPKEKREGRHRLSREQNAYQGGR